MDIFRDVTSARAWRAGVTDSVGFVPTMGSLHDGHLELVRAAREQCATVVVSIYVNPLQFGPAEDFEAYPRDLERDLEMLAPLGPTAVFAPTSLEVASTSTRLHNPDLSRHWCGAGRPGHFEGVLTVVSRLFHVLRPDRAWFGQKDYQQLRIIQKWVEDLMEPVRLESHPIVRDSDGLALSSRNAYLSPEERERALGLSRALQALQTAFSGGETQSSALINMARRQMTGLDEEYFGIADPHSLEPLKVAQPGSVALVAARCGSTRLIDNHILHSVN